MHSVTKLFHGPTLTHQINQSGAGFDQPTVQVRQFQHDHVGTTHRLHGQAGVLTESVDVDGSKQRVTRSVSIGFEKLLTMSQLILECLLPLQQLPDDLLLPTLFRPPHIEHRLVWKFESCHVAPTCPTAAAAC